MKKILIFIFVFLSLVILFSFFKKQKLGGYWLCQNNKWQKIGNPSYSKPKVSCPKKITLPKTKEECLKQEGRWKKWGVFPKESCNLKTIDEGSLCFDNSECQGWCKLKLTQEELRKKEKEFKTEEPGQCSKWVIEFGCFTMMEKGKAKKICFD